MAKGQTNPAIIADELNRSMPAAARAELGAWQQEMTANFNAMLAKLDGDAGVSATNYLATLRVKPPEER